MVTKRHVRVALAMGFLVTLPVLALAQASSAGRISGQVRDADGGAPPALRVEASRLATGAGRVLQTIGSARADEDGRYRIEGLPAGDYVVAAVRIVDAGTPGQPAAPPPTYYPGVIDEFEAQAITVADRGEASNIDFRLRTNPGVRVTGVMVTHDNKPLRTGQVTMSPVNPSGTVVGPTARARIYPDGGFFFLNILPGRYLLRASGQTFKDKQSLSATRTIEVASTSVTDLKLVLQPGGPAAPPAPSAPVAPAPPPPAQAPGVPPQPPTPPSPVLEPVPPPVGGSR